MPLPPPRQNPSRHQQGQMFGHIGLGRTGQGDDLAYITRHVTHRLKDAQAHGFPQHLKQEGDLIELLRSWNGRVHYFGLTHELMVIHLIL